MKLKLYLGVIIILLAGLVAAGCANGEGTPEPQPPTDGFTEAESLQIALDYLTNSPTFRFDGIDGSIEHKETLDAFCASCWGFVFEFQCAHAGYGDRTGQIVAQVITTHEAIISVNQGVVDGGTIDGIWDMETQQEIEPPQVKTAEHE